MHEHNSFITLTYNDDKLPRDFSVHPREFELFMKRLREAIDVPIRFFGCGEYGGKTFRPHYHSLIFGFAFPDRRLHGYTKRGYPIFTSVLLSKLWPYGYSSIGNASWRTAAYTARYTLKKIDDTQELPAGVKSWDEVRVHKLAYYNRIHPLTGELVTVQPEFLRMSRMPGLGLSWAHQFKSDWFPGDFIVLDGKKFPVPPYYVKKVLSEAELKFIKDERRFEGNSPAVQAERNDQRRFMKKVVRDARVAQLTREL